MNRTTKMLLASKGSGRRSKYPEDDMRDWDDYHRKEMPKGNLDAGEKKRYHDRELTRETADQWVASMDKPDGGKGGKWTYDQAVQLMKAKGFDCDPAVFYAVINMLYSDYGKTLAKYGITSQDAFADLARDWIKDDDVAAGDHKTEMYYQYIVK